MPLLTELIAYKLASKQPAIHRLITISEAVSKLCYLLLKIPFFATFVSFLCEVELGNTPV